MTILQALKQLVGAIVDVFLERTKLMATFDEVVASVVELRDAVAVIDGKLDEARALIESLKAASGPVSQEQLDSLAALLADLKVSAAAVVQEADDLA